ncbi:hypothetical protein B7463_g8175, partial [Scytalidium lignicola]
MVLEPCAVRTVAKPKAEVDVAAKASCPQAGKLDSPGMTVPVVVIVGDNDEDCKVEEEVVVGIDAEKVVDGIDDEEVVGGIDVEEEVIFDDDDEFEVEEEVVVEIDVEDEVPSGPAVAGTTVSPPVKPKEVVEETVEIPAEAEDDEDVCEANDDDVVEVVVEFELGLVLVLELIVCRQVVPVQTVGRVSERVHLKHQLRALNSPHIHKRQNVSTFEIARAQKILNEAVTQQSKYNSYRLENPRRNTYVSRHSKEAKTSKRKTDDEPTAPPLNATVLAAASLIAEVNAAAQLKNGTLHKTYPQPQYVKKFNAATNLTKRAFGDAGYGANSHGDAYWVPNVAQTGHAPMGYDDSYMVFRDVTNPLFGGGAKGDGLTDDTNAINAAIAYQGNCGFGCNSSSVKGTLIYFPPGTYLISTPINAYYYTQLVGDINDLPVIKTSQQFIGLGAIQSDVYIPNENNKAAGFHWQVAQATSMTNVYINMEDDNPNSTQMGLFTENGSGGFMSDCFISGGAYGIYRGNQQYTVRNFEFSGQQIAGVCLLWDWGWTWSGLTFAGGTPIGFLLIPPASENSLTTPGSIYVMDSLFDGTATAIDARAVNGTIMDTSIITLDNIGVLNVDTMIAFANGYDVLIPAENTDFVIVGNVGTSGTTGLYTADVQSPPPGLLDLTSAPWFRNNYFGKNRPQYETLDTGSIISVKDHGAVGDGVTDDTEAIQAALALATTSNLIYFPAGSYIVTSTINVPSNIRMTGQVWSQIVASGPFFADASNPQVMVRVGAPNDVGTVEISDMLFTSTGALPGLIVMEWNVQAETQGSVGMWDAHFRVGGAIGTELQVAQCPPQPTTPTGCIAASMMMHITNTSNGYFENVWAWVADHDIDDASNTQVTVAVARGILLESPGPTWLYGTASEHAMLYQYNFAETVNTFAGMIQTESPYFQYADATESPGPFADTVGLFSNDPSFPDDPDTCAGTDLLCNFAWSVLLDGVTNLTVAGAGLYSWFDAYDQSICVDAQNCQQRLVNDQGFNAGLYVWNLVTIGSVEMVSDTYYNTSIFAANNTQLDSHPFWSALAAYANDASSDEDECDDESTESWCMIDTYCDYTIQFSSLEAINASDLAGLTDPVCSSYYTLQVLSDMLDTEVTNYTKVNSGYDGVFGDYVKEMVPDALHQFMAESTPSNPAGGAGQQYFNCEYSSEDKTFSQACPISYETLFHPGTWNITYTLTDSDGFYKALSDKYSIDQSNASSCTKLHTQQPQGYHLTQALPQISSMQDTILARQMDIPSGTWKNGTSDVVDVLSMPVFMISQALEAMTTVKQIGEKEKKAKKIALILEILGIIFAFIPLLDEIAPSLEIADGAFEIVSATGNVALAIQGIVADPASAPMQILSALTLGKGKTTDDFASLAAAKRAISADDLSEIGKDFKASEDEMEATLKQTCFLKT